MNLYKYCNKDSKIIQEDLFKYGVKKNNNNSPSEYAKKILKNMETKKQKTVYRDGEIYIVDRKKKKDIIIDENNEKDFLMYFIPVAIKRIMVAKTQKKYNKILKVIKPLDSEQKNVVMAFFFENFPELIQPFLKLKLNDVKKDKLLDENQRIRLTESLKLMQAIYKNQK